MAETNLKIKRDIFVIGEQYAMFPINSMRAEVTYPEQPAAWGFFANRSNRSVILIKYEPQNLDVIE